MSKCLQSMRRLCLAVFNRCLEILNESIESTAELLFNQNRQAQVIKVTENNKQKRSRSNNSHYQ